MFKKEYEKFLFMFEFTSNNFDDLEVPESELRKPLNASARGEVVRVTIAHHIRRRTVSLCCHL